MRAVFALALMLAGCAAGRPGMIADEPVPNPRHTVPKSSAAERTIDAMQRETERIRQTLDPLDFRHEELCAICGGAGSVPDNPRPEETPRQPGFAADQI